MDLIYCYRIWEYLVNLLILDFNLVIYLDYDVGENGWD
jgi:hypothetical protein